MKIKITCPVPEFGFLAGLTYDAPDEIAQRLIDEEKAFQVEETPVKPKKVVNHDNG